MADYNIYVGFGGAGGKTLAAFAELAAQDHQLQPKLDRCYFFVLVDTDDGELDKAEARIRAALHPHCAQGALVLERLPMGMAGVSFAEEVLFTLRGSGGSLRDCWWHDGDRPQTVPDMEDTTKGAGQIPLVSWFLGWRKAQEIESLVERLTRAVAARDQGGSPHGPQVNLTVVCSLAGGTGRGCWSLLALKIREAFKHRNYHMFPIGIFLDASVFDWLGKNETTRVKVNALTGISELTMWLRNDRNGQRKARFVLPDQRRPEVYAVDSFACLGEIAADQPTMARGAAPISHAFLAFGEGRVGYVDGHQKAEAFFRMLATGLYCMNRAAFQSAQVNWGEPLHGFGSAWRGVEAAEIQAFLGKRLGLQFCHGIVSRDEAHIAATSEALRAELLDASKLASEVVTLATVESQKSGVLAAYLQAIGVGGGVNGSPRQDLAEATRLAREEIQQASPEQLRGGLRLLMERLCRRSARELSGRDPGALLAEEVVEQVRRRILATDASRLTPGEGAAVLSRLIGMVEAEGTEPARGDWAGGDSLESLEQRTKSVGTKAYIVFGPHFEADEQEELSVKAVQTFKSANEAEARKMVQALLSAVARRLAECATLLEQTTAGVETLATEQRQAIDRDIRRHFYVETDSAMDLAGAMLYQPETLMSRRLKPVWDRTLEKALDEALKSCADAANTEAQAKVSDALHLIAAELEREVGAEGELAEDIRDDLMIRVRRALREAIRLARFPAKALREALDLKSVVAAMRRPWLNALKRTPDGSALASLKKQFAEVFGFELDPADPPEDLDLLAGLAAMTAATCQPFVTVPRHSRARVTVCVPTCGFSVQQLTDRIRQRAEALNQELRGAQLQIEFEDSNPFCIVAFSHEPFPDWTEAKNFGGVGNVGYWADPDVVRAVRAAEAKPGGENLTFHGEFTGKTGMGYVDPRFVLDDAWAEQRWRPWHTLSAARQATLRPRLLSYALLGNLPAHGDPGTETVLGRIAAAGWELPLMRRAGNKWEWLRSAYVRSSSNERGFEARGKAWQKADPVSLKSNGSSSLKTVVDWFRGADAAAVAELEEEYTLFAGILHRLELRREELNALRHSVGALADELIKDSRGKWDDDVLEELKAFLVEVEAAAEALSPSVSA